MSQAPKYTPNPVPDNPEDLPQYLLQEFQKIQAALEENPIAFIEEKNVEPSRVKQGDIVYADGTNWNPGQGENLYYYDGSVWRAFAGGSGAGDFAQIADTTQQTISSADTAQAVTWNTLVSSQGITINGVDTSKIEFSKTGKYFIDFSALVHSNNASDKDIYFFPKISGTDIAGSGIFNTIHSNNHEKTLSKAGIFNITAGQYLQVMMASDSTDLDINVKAATGFAPATPSATITLIQVSQ
jgi:hypothetical protein